MAFNTVNIFSDDGLANYNFARVSSAILGGNCMG